MGRRVLNGIIKKTHVEWFKKTNYNRTTALKPTVTKADSVILYIKDLGACRIAQKPLINASATFSVGLEFLNFV